LKDFFDNLSDLNFRQTEYLRRYNGFPVAIYYGDRSIVETLLKKDIDINVSNKYFNYVLYTAVYYNNINIVGVLFIVKLFLERNNIDFNIIDNFGRLPL
jgi:ankyrin repeat protein